MLDKDFLGYLSLLLTAIAGTPYLVSMWRGQTRPHLFSWIIWTMVTMIAAAGQYSGHAGPGGWATCLSAAYCLATTILLFKYGEPGITRSDCVAFAVGLSAIPVWYVTSDPLPAVVIATAIDMVAYYPTFRKSYVRPHEELAFNYVVHNVKHIAAIGAMQVYSTTTLLYPLVMFAMNSLFVLMLLKRRRALPVTAAK